MDSILFNGKEYSESSLKAYLRDNVKKTLMNDRDYRFVMRCQTKRNIGKKMSVNAMIDRIVENSYNKLMQNAI